MSQRPSLRLIDSLAQNAAVLPPRVLGCPEEGTRRVTEATGLVLLDGHGECVYINSIAQSVICFPKNFAHEPIREEIRSRLLPLCRRPGCQSTMSSGRRTYICRTLMLEAGANETGDAIVAVVLERASRRNEKLRKLCEYYKLTSREPQVVFLLTQGLTDKEIAQRMDVSPHTIKGFIHLIMLKLGVTTRSGVVGRITFQ